MKAIWHGQIIAESDDTVVVEGNHYFPRTSLDEDTIVESSNTTLCPWKGTAHYYSREVDGETNTDAVWYYPEPKSEAAEIGGRVAFWRGVEISN